MLCNSFLRDDIFHPTGRLLKNQSACARHLSWSEPSLAILDGVGTLEISVLLRVLPSSPHCSWKFEERKDLVHLISFRDFSNLGVIYFLSFNQSSFRRSSWSNTASSSQSGKTQEIQRPWRKFVAGMKLMSIGIHVGYNRNVCLRICRWSQGRPDTLKLPRISTTITTWENQWRLWIG